jgi:hypothetical protein
MEVFMKKITVMFSCLMILSSVALASPLTDFSAGKGSIDLMVQKSPVYETTPGWTYQYPSTNTVQYGVTVGLGNNFAFQFRDDSAKSANTSYSAPAEPDNGNTVNGKLTAQAFNVLYKVNPNIIAFAGVMSTKFTFTNFTNSVYEGSTNTKNTAQVGLTGITKLGGQTTAYASVVAGKDLTSYEVGLSQEIATHLELNIGYRDIVAKNFLAPDGTHMPKYEAKGMVYGITYKF